MEIGKNGGEEKRYLTVDSSALAKATAAATNLDTRRLFSFVRHHHFPQFASPFPTRKKRDETEIQHHCNRCSQNGSIYTTGCLVSLTLSRGLTDVRPRSTVVWR